jgi:hypothetical protein
MKGRDSFSLPRPMRFVFISYSVDAPDCFADHSYSAGPGEGVRGVAGATGSEMLGLPVAPGCPSGGETDAHITAASTIRASRPTKSITPDVVGTSLL